MRCMTPAQMRSLFDSPDQQLLWCVDFRATKLPGSGSREPAVMVYRFPVHLPERASGCVG